MECRKSCYQLPLVLAVGLGCLSLAHAQNKLPNNTQSSSANSQTKDSPFAYLPLSMQSETVTTTSTQGKKRPPPNVMLFIDDSGSMSAKVPAKDPNQRDECRAGFTFREAGGFRMCIHNTQVSKFNNCATPFIPFQLVKNIQGQTWNSPFCYDYRRQAVLLPHPSAGGDKYFYYFNEVFTAPTRLEIVKTALSGSGGVLETYKDNFNWSVRTLWGTENGQKTGGTNNNFTSDYQKVKQLVDRMTPEGGTPATINYLRSAEHLINNIQYACQQNYIIMLSDGDPNENEQKRNKFNLVVPVSPDERNAPYRYKKWLNLANAASGSYEVNSEGLTNGIAFYSQQLNQQDLKTGGVDIEGNSWDDEEFPKQTIKTYTIGFGEGLGDRGRKYLADAASPRNGQTKVQSNGNIPEDMARSFFYNASDKDAVVAAFKDAVQDIAAAQQEAAFQGSASYSFSSPAVTGAEDKGFPALGALLTLDLQKWSSVLKFAKIDAKGQPQKDSKGQAEYVSADYSSRQIVVNNGSNNYIMKANNSSDAGIFGFTGFDDFEQFKQWYMRDAGTSDEKIEQTATTKTKRKVKNYRKRSESAADPERMMGDVMGTPLLAIRTAGQTKAGAKYMVTAANDGLVYIFGQNEQYAANPTTQAPYNLKANYLPAGMQRESKDDTDTVGTNLYQIAEKGYGKTIRPDSKESNPQPHLFLNNGGLQWRTTAKDSSGHQATYLAGAMGQGGRGAYVLAIGGQDRLGKSVGFDGSGTLDKTLPLWETAKGEENKLGYTYSTPQFAQIATDENNKLSGIRQFLFLANGYPTKDTSIVGADVAPALYVYDALGQEMGKSGSSAGQNQAAGTLVKKIEVTGGKGGLSTPLLVDIDGDALADVAYAGDRGGNVYRFTLKGKPESWTVSKIYEGNEKQPIIASPAVYHDKPNNRFVVMVGTGSDIYQSDKDNTDLQVMLGIFDTPSSDAPTQPIKQTELTKRFFAQQNAHVHKGQDTNTRELAAGQKAGDKGWYIELKYQVAEGERVVTKAQVLNKTAFFTSRIYKSTVSNKGSTTSSKTAPYTCKADTSSTTITSEASSWLYSVNVLEGANPDAGSAFLDIAVSNQNNQQAGNAGGANGNDQKKVVAGLQLKGLASAVSLNSVSTLNRPILAVDPNGGFGDGEDRNAGEQETRDNTCVEQSDYNASVVDDTGLQGINIQANVCVRGHRLIRVSTRQIYK